MNEYRHIHSFIQSLLFLVSIVVTGTRHEFESQVDYRTSCLVRIRTTHVHVGYNFFNNHFSKIHTPSGTLRSLPPSLPTSLIHSLTHASLPHSLTHSLAHSLCLPPSPSVWIDSLLFFFFFFFFGGGRGLYDYIWNTIIVYISNTIYFKHVFLIQHSLS